MSTDKLPDGVVLVDQTDPLVVSPNDISILREITTYHPQGTPENANRALLEAEYRRVMEAYRDDFSCGKAIRVTVGMSLRYEPADLDRRVGEHMTAFAAKLATPTRDSWVHRAVAALYRRAKALVALGRT